MHSYSCDCVQMSSISCFCFNSIFVIFCYSPFRFDNEIREDLYIGRLNCFLSKTAVIEYIDDLSETDNEQNKRSEEKQKTQPFPCVEVGFAPVLLSYEKNGERIFPRSPPRRIESSSSSFLRPFLSHSLPSSSFQPSHILLPSLFPSRDCACLAFSLVHQKGRERATKGGKVRRETTGRHDDDYGHGGGSWRVGTKRINTFALGLPRFQGRGISWCTRTFQMRPS